MNDLERTKEFLTSLGIGHEEKEFKHDKHGNVIGIELRGGIHDKVEEYAFFTTVFIFNQQGEFLVINIWD